MKLQGKRVALLAENMYQEMELWVPFYRLKEEGAVGYSCELPLERMVRDARMFAIGGGTVEVQRNLIAARILGARGAA